MQVNLSFSKDLSAAGAFIFDADKEAAKIEALYPGLPSESVSYAVEQYFQDCTAQSLKSKTDFAVETNLRDAGLMNHHSIDFQLRLLRLAVPN